MGKNYYIACDVCKKRLSVGKTKPAGVDFWSGSKKTMDSLGLMIKNCIGHLESLNFVWENDMKYEDYELIEEEMNLNIKGARTQHLWGDNFTAMFCNERLTEAQAERLLAAQPDKVIELLYVGDGKGWKSLLRNELTD